MKRIGLKTRYRNKEANEKEKSIYVSRSCEIICYELRMRFAISRFAMMRITKTHRIFSGLVPTCAAINFFRSPMVSSSLHFTLTFFPSRSLQITSIILKLLKVVMKSYYYFRMVLQTHKRRYSHRQRDAERC